MRISCREESPYYYERRFNVIILFNGQETKCIEADEEEGWIIRYQADEKDNVILNELRTEILTETLYGKVKILFKDKIGK